MRVKIFNCCHAVPQHTIMTPLFSTLLCNHFSDKNYLGDLDGRNIASEVSMSEIRQQYYVWKNLLHHYDFVGFEHYRRPFFTDIWDDFKLASKSEELMIFRGHFIQNENRAYLCPDKKSFEDFWLMRKEFNYEDISRFSHVVASNDIILSRSIIEQDLESQWKTCLPLEYWRVMMECVLQTKLAKESKLKGHMRISNASYNNMYIMRSELFDEYMTFFFEIINLMKTKVSSYDRIWGHCSERLINIFCYFKRLQDPKLRFNRMPFLFNGAEYIK